MKKSEMNENQLKVYYLAIEATRDYIGGWENQLDDSSEDSEDYLDAKKALSLTHEELVETIAANVRCSREWKRIENLHFVTLDWMKERISRRLTKWGY